MLRQELPVLRRRNRDGSWTRPERAVLAPRSGPLRMNRQVTLGTLMRWHCGVVARGGSTSPVAACRSR